MEEIAVSIIIPVYNAEKFLRKGLDSCVNQTLQNIEIICVNDVSTDNSSAVIKEYVNKYPEKVIELELAEKRGQGGARNQGILHARGEYLCFMDSDDYLDIHLCEDVYAEAKIQDADMVFYDFIRVDGGQEYPVELIGQEEIDLWYAHCGWAVWMQLIKRDIILRNQLFSPENMRADDDAIVPLWKYYAKRRIKMHKPYYYYVYRNNSLSNEIKLSSIMAPIIGVIPYRYQIMLEKGLLDKYMAESDLMIARDIYRTLTRLLKSYSCLTVEDLLYMRQKLNILDERDLDESLIRYNMQHAEVNMVKDFLYNTQHFIEKYGDCSYFKSMRIEQGLDRGIECEIRNILTVLQKRYGANIVIWGAGEKGISVISTLMRMGYDFQIFDNAKQGQEIWENANTYIHSFQEFENQKIDIVLVTSDFYYKAIQNQIHEKYPRIEVVNFMRTIRNLVNKEKEK